MTLKQKFSRVALGAMTAVAAAFAAVGHVCAATPSGVDPDVYAAATSSTASMKPTMIAIFVIVLGIVVAITLMIFLMGKIRKLGGR